MSVRALLGVALAGCDALPPCEGDEFVAMQSDFEDWESWRRFELEPSDPWLGEGARSVYVNAMPPAGSASFPRCTMIVKVDEVGDDPTTWSMVGMAKRGGAYNAEGALGWEWFHFELSESSVPVIEWRGIEGGAYVSALGEEEVEAIGGCNTCHAAAAANDYVLSPVLELSPR